MGWREAIDRLIPEIADGWECGSDVAEYILRLDEPDRIALARELLPPGFVVARDVGNLVHQPKQIGGYGTDYIVGFNDARAAMLGDKP